METNRKKTQKLPTLKDVHTAIKNIPTAKRLAVLECLGSESDQTFYDLLSGRRKLSPAEKEAIAKVYDKKAAEIDWQDTETEKAIA